MKFKSCSSDQLFLLPPSLEDLVPEDSLARVISEVVDYLDLTQLYQKYSHDGCPAYHPKMLLRILFYAYSNGIQGSRKIALRLKQDTHFMFLSGMQTPDFRTISDFRKNNYELLQEFFKQIVLYCVQLGMVSVGHISIDGTKVKASASKKKSRDEDSLEKELKKLEQEISNMFARAAQIDEEEDQFYGNDNTGHELPSKIQDKLKRKQQLVKAKEILAERGWNTVNLTDTDGHFMQTNSGKEISYNAQAAVDSDNQVIIANDVVTDGNDFHQFISMYEQTVENVGKQPEKVSTDCGYATHQNYQYMQEHDIDGYVPPDLETFESDTDQDPYSKDCFQYDPVGDIYTCPQGKHLHFYHTRIKRGNEVKIYRSHDCSDCPVVDSCLQKSNKSRKRHLHRYSTDDYISQMRQKLRSAQGRQIYDKRKTIVEPVFGNIKYNLGFDRFSLRGLEKVAGEFNLMCIAHNLRKIYKLKSKISQNNRGKRLFFYKIFQRTKMYAFFKVFGSFCVDA
jgi:transposase